MKIQFTPKFRVESQQSLEAEFAQEVKLREITINNLREKFLQMANRVVEFGGETMQNGKMEEPVTDELKIKLAEDNILQEGYAVYIKSLRNNIVPIARKVTHTKN